MEPHTDQKAPEPASQPEPDIVRPWPLMANPLDEMILEEQWQALTVAEKLEEVRKDAELKRQGDEEVKKYMRKKMVNQALLFGWRSEEDKRNEEEEKRDRDRMKTRRFK